MPDNSASFEVYYTGRCILEKDRQIQVSDSMKLDWYDTRYTQTNNWIDSDQWIDRPQIDACISYIDR